MNNYRAIFRRKNDKSEVHQDTLAHSASDAVTQCIVGFCGRGFIVSEYDMVHLGPHPDEIQVPLLTLLSREAK